MSQMQKLPAFKAYDIRGRMPDQLNEFMVYCIGKAYAQVMKPTSTDSDWSRYSFVQ
jgi:phosphomannomutase